MATLAVIHTFAVGNPDLQTKFKAARLQVAWNILADAGASVGRKAWADKIFTDYEADLGKEYRWCLSHSNIQTAGAGITDANLVAAVTSFVDVWSA